MRAPLLVLSPLVLAALVLGACGPHRADPATSPATSASASATGSTADLATTWTRLAWLEGRWVTPPESGTLPPLEILANPPTLRVRSGAGQQDWSIVGVSTTEGATRLTLRGADGSAAEARFVPWAQVTAARPATAPPAGAWGVALPGKPLVGDVAWYPGR